MLKAEDIYLESVKKLLHKYHDIIIFRKRIKNAAVKDDAEEFLQAILALRVLGLLSAFIV
jgi:hypothetical protein